MATARVKRRASCRRPRTPFGIHDCANVFARRKSLRQAVALLDRKLWKELETAGVERIDPVGQPFDPSVHEAVSTLPPPKPELDHTVSATFQTGYRFKGNLVRPARVQVYSAQNQA